VSGTPRIIVSELASMGPCREIYFKNQKKIIRMIKNFMKPETAAVYIKLKLL